MTRYIAFISYSHRDRAATEWLHKALESYRIPKALVGTQTAKGEVPARLVPIFRDRDELGAAADLGVQLRAALANSEHLIVVASPAASASQWVNEEIRSYKALHGEDRVLALIVGGEPWSSDAAGHETDEAFPRALRYRLASDGSISDDRAEPIAADGRPQGDGKRLALQKLIAGITGVRLDDLVQREAHRRARRLTIVATGAVVGMVLASGLAAYAEIQRRAAVEQREIARRETAAARAATDYLIGTFELTNPATENPRTVSLVTILGRSADRARTELREQPEIEARLVSAVGRAFNNLGLLAEAEVALARALPAIKRAGPEGASALLTLATTHIKRGQLDRARGTLANAERLLGTAQGEHLLQRAELAATRGQIAYAKGNAEAALIDYDRALAYLRQADDNDPRRLGHLLDLRGNALVDLGRNDEAEKALAAANDLLVRFQGARHLRTGKNWYSRALAAYGAGNYAEAEARIDTSIGIFTDLLDQTNPIRADSLSLKGSILHARGRNREADRALEEAVDAYRQVYGGPHHNIGIAEYYRAQVALELGRTKDAIAYLDDAIINYAASYGAEHPNIGEAMVTRATILAGIGRKDEARQQCAAGLAMLDRTMGPNASFTQGLRENCAALKL